MALKKEAQEKLGELLIVGFNGFELTEQTEAFLRGSGIGGVILFAQNYENPAQMAELTREIQESRGDLPYWICVDQEGGRVQRFKKGFTRLPDAGSIGSVDSAKLAFEIASMVASELHSVGINVNFNPIADIATNPKNPVIGNRAFGPTEALVTRMCTAVVRGHLISGVQPCVKHFPGHGDTSTDSHFALPTVQTSIEVLQEREFKPFLKSFKSRCSMVMTAHILMPKLDPKFPATLSRFILQEYLRKGLRFKGLIISDDMEMKAIADHFGQEEAPRLAIEAGCDLLIYRSEAGGRQAYQVLFDALENGALAPELVLEAADRSRKLKASALLPYRPALAADVGKKVGLAKSQQLVQQVEAHFASLSARKV